ncbi:hypothetical protein [Pararhizobium sp.]|nr:hypothetical protein [Pararhizobium sp.]MDO9417703.1 hypothetical protein [Pararhizobium sp.]
MQTNATFQSISSPARAAKRKSLTTGLVHGCTVLAAFIFVSALVIGIL